jgi:hypothetical protein
MSKFVSLPTSSATSGPVPLGSALANAIGMLRGGTTSVASRLNAHGLPALPSIRASEVQSVALRRDPAELLPPSLRVSLGAPQWTDVAPPAADGGPNDYGADLYVMAYDVPAAVDAAAAVEAQTFAAALRQTCRPLDEQDILIELGKLRVKVARRAEEGADMQLLLEAYTEELRDYPADIVLEVLRLWPSLSKWWPALEELKQPLGWRVRQRTGFLAALEAVAKRGQAAA